MEDRKDLIQAYERYMRYFPEEGEVTAKYRQFILRYDGYDLYDRKNFDGHITASAVIFNPFINKFLLLEHLQLGKWLQPGGHVEEQDASIIDAARREIFEETGIASALMEVKLLKDTDIAYLDIDSHYIPASDIKKEADHYHHDIRFLMSLEVADPVLNIDPTESGRHKWAGPEQMPDYFGFDRVLQKLPLYGITI